MRGSGFRRCTRTSCNERAVATLSYNYSEQVAHLAPIHGVVEPHTYDLCLKHSQSLTVPRGFTIVIDEISKEDAATDEDFNAIATAVRNVLNDEDESGDLNQPAKSELRRRGHLRAL